MNKQLINEAIAKHIMGFEYGDQGCIEGVRYVWRDQKGNLYKDVDYCFPDYYDNDIEAMELANKFDCFTIHKLPADGYIVTGRKDFECRDITKSDLKLSRAICLVALTCWGIEIEFS